MEAGRIQPCLCKYRRINSAVVVGIVRRLFSLALVELIVKPCSSAWEAGDNFSDGEKCQTYQT